MLLFSTSSFILFYMNSISEIEQILSRLSNDKFSGLFQRIDGLMLTGSYALNTTNENSDIDIIVLSKNVNYIYSETIYSVGKYVQLIFFPYFKFQNIILDDKNRGEGIYVSMIRNGIICKDTTSRILTKTKRYILNSFKVRRCDQLDYALIHQITSALDDAIKFTNSGTVGCKANYIEDRLILEISDTGIGIDAEVVGRIFTPFERFASSLNVEGFGLGLSITKGLVDLLEGTIQVDSTLGKGSCFTVTLPLPRTSEKIEEEKNVPLSFGRLPDRVLIIDDDQMQLEITKEILERNGIVCKICRYAKDVVNELRQSHYDLLLTDMQMPGTTGLELLMLLRSSNIGNSKTIPIAVMTARGDMNKEGLIEAGFIGCIHKPFFEKELLDFLSALMAEERKMKKHHPNFAALTRESRDKRKILQLFIHESEENILELEKALQSDDYKRMRETVHRMMPIWELLQVDEILHDYQSLVRNEKILPDLIGEQTRQIISYIRELIREAKNLTLDIDDEAKNIDS